MKRYANKRISVLKKIGQMERLLEEVTSEAGEFCCSNLRGGMTGYANLSILIKGYGENLLRYLADFMKEGSLRSR